MNPSSAKSFAFPARNRLDAFERQAHQARNADLERARADAVERGYADGLERGREEAKAAASELLESSYREGLERGHAAALTEMTPAAEALRAALAGLNLERESIAAEAEAFCVELALAIVASMLEADKARAEFARRATQAALKALAPELPTAICLNPRDLKVLAKVMKDLPLQEDATLAPGNSRVEAGRLLVESSLDEAFAQVRAAVIETKTKRTTRCDATSAEKPDAL